MAFLVTIIIITIIDGRDWAHEAVYPFISFWFYERSTENDSSLAAVRWMFVEYGFLYDIHSPPRPLRRA